MQPYQQLQKVFKRLSQLQYLQRILQWDEAVMMPQGAGDFRAEALATLAQLLQKKLTSKKVGKLLATITNGDNLSSWDKANLAWMKKKYQRAVCIPSSLAYAATKAALASEQAWRKLRVQNDWQAFLPFLEKTFNYQKEIAKRQADQLQLDPYDALLDEYAPNFNQARIDKVFSTLKNTLPNLIQKIVSKQENFPHQPLSGCFPLEKQKTLGSELMQALGFDFNYGRLDSSHHPFSSGGSEDLRITTRYEENDVLKALYAICHETGHALYEYNLPRKWLNQPVGEIHSMAMHESQSLLIEMDVCRSFAFCRYLAAALEKYFGQQGMLSADNVYRLVTTVKPDYIRVDADEVTYPLHIILRYEIEKGLFSQEIMLKDLPAYWNELMQKYFNLSTHQNFTNGVMQDVHWAAGAFGYFPAYTLGRLIASQLFKTFAKQYPHYANDFQQGNFQTLRHWLNVNVCAYGSSLAIDDLLIKITGEDLNSHYFLTHINERYL